MNRTRKHLMRWAAVLTLAIAAGGIGSCATNPATGRRQLSLVGEGQEIAMGYQADTAVMAQMGLYDDQGWQQYVAQLGRRMATASERPQLPWTFRVVDDPVINAFAVPGGFIYMTRGILTHFTSEAQLAAVMGHELAHVTARHSVEQMSKAQLAQVGLGVGMILSPTLAQLGQVAGAGLQVLFLKFGRDDESEADRLGLRYMTNAGYDPRQMAEVFTMLSRSGGSQSRLPTWLSTHPEPGNRREAILQQITTLPPSEGRQLGAETYLERLNGMVFGPNPREGFFQDNHFLHPDLRFQMQFPSGWQTANQKQAVMGMSAEQDAMIQVEMAPQRSLDAAASEFFKPQQGLSFSNPRRTQINGLPAVAGEFRAETQQGQLQGLAVFIEHGGAVFRLLGYGPATAWPARAGQVDASFSSFARLTDPSALNVQPNRLEIVRLPQAMTLGEFIQRYPSAPDVKPETIALINQAELNTQLPAGSMVKRVVTRR